MKKFAAITVIGLALGFSNSAFAVNFVDLHSESRSSQAVSTEVRGGEVETSPSSFYLNPVKQGGGRRHTAKVADNDEPTLFVFGVGL